ncbi:MAG TPA: DUF2934 domain-containing protein [Tepidiformaceae bacterium]|nr:DUF2934 domain-containing protein [Tepidiformaceae bacterium]
MDHENDQLPTTEPGNPYHERIAERAHAIYEERGGDDGSDLDHWLEAEREVLQQVHGDDQPADSIESEDDVLQQEPHIEEHAIELEGGVIV